MLHFANSFWLLLKFCITALTATHIHPSNEGISDEMGLLPPFLLSNAKMQGQVARC